MPPELPDAELEFEVRASIYGLLARLLLAPPDPALLETLRAPDFIAEWPWGRGTARVEEGLTHLHRAAPAATVAALTDEYRELFWGPGPVLAPPWESVYLDREHVVFGEQTLQVRSLFHRFGLESEQVNHEPDDHIGLQLQFLSELSGRTAARLKEGDWAGASPLLLGLQECMDDHLLRWNDAFLERILIHGRSDFYKGVALVVRGTLDSDRHLLRNLLSAAPTVASERRS